MKNELTGVPTAKRESIADRLMDVMRWNSKRFHDGAKTEHFRRASLDAGLIKLYSAVKSVSYFNDPSAEELEAIATAIKAVDDAIVKMEKL